jgi:hypothetical protein
MDEESHKEFDVMVSLYVQHAEVQELVSDITPFDCSEGERTGHWILTYPNCTNSSIRV